MRDGPVLINRMHHRHRFSICVHWMLGIALVVVVTATALAQESETFADTHLHYNWDQVETVTPKAAIQRLSDNDVVLAVVSSTPPELALELRRAGGAWVVPLFMPYLEPERRHSWFNDERVLGATEQALASGEYFGIGEFHLNSGFAPSPKNRHPVVDGLMDLAARFDVPALIHTEASDYRYFLPLCERHPGVRIQWAHAGGILPPEQVDALLTACPNVWAELAARDNERYISAPIVDARGALLPAWERLVRKYPDRFLTGSDPVWPVDNRHPWDQPDTGWDRIDTYIDFHRRWIGFLPEALAEKLRVGNAQEFYRLAERPQLRLRR